MIDLDVAIWRYLALAGIAPALAFGTSEWWWPRMVAKVRRRSQLQLAPESAMVQTNGDLERFKACLPHITQCRQLVGPFASPFGGLTMGLQHLSTAGDTIIELLTELGYLARSLDALGIRCPAVYGATDESDSDFRVRLRIWNTHLTKLTVMIRHDDLAGARRLRPLMQPTPDKSDAQC